MAGAIVVGDYHLRKEDIDPIVKGFALQSYIFKDSLMIKNSKSWKDTYYRETAADLTGGTGSAVRGIPRGAAFPQGQVNWTKVSAYIEKYGMEGTIYYEDTITDEIDVASRTLLRIARAVTKAVDDQIYSEVSSNAGNSVTISVGYEWDSATIAQRNPIQDILNAIKLINIDNYDIQGQNGELWLNPTDYTNLLGNSSVVNAGQFYTKTVTKTGKIEHIVGLRVKVSNSVTDDEAIVMIPKISGTWVQVDPLRTKTTVDEGISWTVRAFELGVVQITNPNAIAKITNTQA